MNYSCKTNSASAQNCSDVKVRYIEMYGSICCPKDYKHDNHLLTYIKDFEIKNNVLLSCNYKLQLGKEAEAAYFLSLENLSEELREKFIEGRKKVLVPNDKSIINYIKNPITLKKALLMWENTNTNNLIPI